MSGQLGIGGIGFWIVPAWTFDGRAKVVGYDDFRRATKEFQSIDVAAKPEREALRWHGFGITEMASAPGGDENLCLQDGAGVRVMNGDGGASEIDK